MISILAKAEKLAVELRDDLLWIEGQHFMRINSPYDDDLFIKITRNRDWTFKDNRRYSKEELGSKD